MSLDGRHGGGAAARAREIADKVSALLVAFLKDRAGGARLLGTKDPFKAPPRSDRIIAALVEYGVLEEVSEGCWRWTAKAARSLIDAGRWDDDGTSRDDLIRAELVQHDAEMDARAEAMIASAPAWVGQSLARVRAEEGPFVAMKSLNRLWAGQAWRDRPDESVPLGYTISLELDLFVMRALTETAAK